MNLPDKKPVIKKNWVQRSLTTTFLISYLIFVTYIGVPGIWITTLGIQIKCFQEILEIAYSYKKLPEIPLFRTLNWYFLFVVNYAFGGDVFALYLEVFSVKFQWLHIFFKYHRFISFCMYILGLVWFLNLLRRKNIRLQFSLLAWVHFLCMIIVLQSYMLVKNLFEGLIWTFLPVMLVVLNDIFAYIFGRTYGKTPLIQVSPNKTMEGYYGGGIATLVFGSMVAWALCHIDHMVCPTKFLLIEDSIKMSTQCNRTYIFQPQPISFGLLSINYYPFIFHVIILTLFASIIAPFGGFCASGFKRAFNVKDFGDMIPGHGGMMDRFDCQYLMATFVNVYIISFIRNYNVEKIFARVLSMDDVGQVEFYMLLQDSLKSQRLISDTP